MLSSPLPRLSERWPPPAGVRLRRAGAGDGPGVAAMNQNESVLAGLLQVPFPSPEAWRARLAESEKPDAQQLVLVAEHEGRIVGHAGLMPATAHLRRRHTASLGIAVHPDFQRRGLGSALMAALCDYADRWAQWTRLELSVFVDNEAAVALYRRFGFEHEGRMRGFALRDGEYIDVFMMARLHPRPPQLPPQQLQPSVAP
jgi:L-phenylalanine/L-methionine N-acetyltransferase